MNREEREQAAEELRRGLDALLRTVEGVSDAQAKFKPAPDKWSVEEIVEHLAYTEHGMYRLITGYAEPVDEPADPNREARLRERAMNRAAKWSAPEAALPKGRYGSLTAALRQFQANRERTIAWVEGCEDDLRACAVQHPVGRITGQECLILLVAHPLRHAEQIREVRESSGFPA